MKKIVSSTLAVGAMLVACAPCFAIEKPVIKAPVVQDIQLTGCVDGYIYWGTTTGLIYREPCGKVAK